MSQLLKELEEAKLIAIIRGITYKEGKSTAQALRAGGIRFLEITLNTDGALDMIADAKHQFGEEMRIGAGTVLNLEMAKEAVAAGAEYIVSPNVNEAVIDYGLAQGVEVLPGTFTPTEIVNAYEAGAAAVKVFPIGAMGTSYLKNIRGPLCHIPMMVTGGINTDNIYDYLQAGAFSAGLGGNLCDVDAIKKGDFQTIQDKAEAYIHAIKRGLQHGGESH
ncbi:bifunctional 4-hydroxy-2-oxoglutarate aldolase/2-dehydro-3-deoxy-phosphogluconate aldolase [Paenalkalicoccus suaedae]|uniref:Bifunctional 4-hydroxy-2-oxoglutarate aldolase/2-dehydro-3-deoxy-phosphogluconate aldolase n=1 Tax=Paenalkalicoccus suaedae TaxID=2592382 RepID=A0A859FBW7_9BACI|nr:bifunctional 4-hydroxy-2-oxoglutarate aldolase/2-dehydro-3-deoxy-phosphogluconate aldolase [Paenalkalicoccus suaedae]QKS69726.1 bifunctional 4-hydroxy-2-oxoglutarate aldolase/2-dehydro-3-deoxy-phosphogluconate aldolase [Paenalkalicoccus suaedae]